MIRNYSEAQHIALMERAIELAKKSRAEVGEISPLVGAVAVRPDGRILGEAFRGEKKFGEHAEYTLLERKLEHVTLTDSILYTTLEPCTGRNHPKVPCVQHVLARKIKHVVIGVLDPNPDICGKGERLLVNHGVEISRFPYHLIRQIEEINRHFNRLHEGSRTQPSAARPVRARTATKTFPSSPSLPSPKPTLSTKAAGWDPKSTYPTSTPFERKLGLSSDSREEHERRTEVADELRDLKEFMASRRGLEGEVLAAFVVNTATDNLEMPASSFHAQVDSYATMHHHDGYLHNLKVAGVLTYDEEEKVIGLGPAHDSAIQYLCEFFDPRDYDAAKRVLSKGKWDSVIPEGL